MPIDPFEYRKLCLKAAQEFKAAVNTTPLDSLTIARAATTLYEIARGRRESLPTASRKRVDKTAQSAIDFVVSESSRYDE